MGSNSLDPQELRFSLLFWDRLDCPTNNFIHIGLGPDEAFLEQEGTLRRSRVRFSGGGDVAQTFLLAHLSAYRQLDVRETGRWSLARGERSISFRPSELEADRGALFTLFQSIPVPDRQVPLADILEFKARRHPELLSLRHHLERLYQSIVAAPDRSLAMATELDDLDRAIADHIKTSREAKFPFRLSGFQAKLDWKLDWKNVSGGSATFLSASKAGLPLSTSLLAGFAAVLGMGASVSLGVTAGLRGHKPSTTPFEYVSMFHEEL